MLKKVMSWKTKGMNRDLSVSAFNPEFSFENLNLRLSTNEGNTMMSWVNEKGPSLLRVSEEGSNPLADFTLKGSPVGYAVLNHYLVLFTHDSNSDYIYRLHYDGSRTNILCKQLFPHLTSSLISLGFDIDYPLETLVSYESDKIQKVYWTDNKNQPRVINIADEETSYSNTSFDFVNELKLNEEITVEKQLGTTGMFPAGVIQYAFTYYHKYGQESNIFYTTPLLYTSYKDRGAAADDRVENAFKITIKGVDQDFEYLRIYSIMRTSINGTPIVKRVQDISTQGLEDVSQTEPVDRRKKAVFVDPGTVGNLLDPTELLYKGGEAILAKTLEQKDGTLFLGNLTLNREEISSADRASIKNGMMSCLHANANDTRTITFINSSFGSYEYGSQLNAKNSSNVSVPCGGFKSSETYRCGIQFQHKTGRWSTPIFIKDIVVEGVPSGNSNTIHLPVIKGTIPTSVSTKALKYGYKRARAVVVFPEAHDRTVVCQGVVCPTLYTNNHRNTDKDLYAQASWFFRQKGEGDVDSAGAISPYGPAGGTNFLKYTSNQVESNYPDTTGTIYDPSNIKLTEIQGDYEPNNKYQVDWSLLTLHTPELCFDDQLLLADFSNVAYKKTGYAKYKKTLSDIDIQTETPTASSNGSGFVHKSFTANGTHGIVSGLFYDDYVVDEWDDEEILAYDKEHSPVKWMVYTWNKTGSLNNDFTRPADKGIASAKLSKKRISNLRFAESTIEYSPGAGVTASPQVFSSDVTDILKLNIVNTSNSNLYQGNIDTSLIPDNTDGQYFMFSDDNIQSMNVKTGFTDNAPSHVWKTFMKDAGTGGDWGLWKYLQEGGSWLWKKINGDIGNKYKGLVLQKGAVRMKYRSTSHIVLPAEIIDWTSGEDIITPIVEIRQNPTQRFGGESEDALRENTWVPCGEPVKLDSEDSVDFEYSYGDTYYQRWDCLKTYAYTHEDENQVVEIGSFMLESHINMDGRYDRNRGLLSNIHVSPQNFNLLNPVYSQIDNFFSYKTLPDDAYDNHVYPNQLTWTLTKQSGADVDPWTTITLASQMELDGDKGSLQKIIRYNDQLLAFQDTGISQLLYNENVQIASTNGVPIEIANSGKVQGRRYLSNTIGCSNKWSITDTPSGIYFMDSNDKSIFLFNGQLQNLSQQLGFSSWCKQNIPASEVEWRPDMDNGFRNFMACYDKKNQDVLFVNSDIALAFSEKIGAFTSFYSYGNIPYFCNLDDTGLWVNKEKYQGIDQCNIYLHQGGYYSTFFGKTQPYSMTFVGNPDVQLDKVFTNIEFRACVDGDGTYPNETGGFTPALPFDAMEVWNEYQHGYTSLSNRNGHSAMVHHEDIEGQLPDSSLKRRFRIWRSDIPRNNCVLDTYWTDNLPYHSDAQLGISRYTRKPQDRMRNPWIYLRLWKNAISPGALQQMPRVEIHDIQMIYYI